MNLFETFNSWIVDHEQLVADLLKTKRVKTTRFHDFYGEVKSLGAWGGDFYLVTDPQNDEKALYKYFEDKGLKISLYANLHLKKTV